MLYEFNQRLEEQTVIQLGFALGVSKHQTARQIWIVRNGHHIAVAWLIDALLAQASPEFREVVSPRFVGTDGCIDHIMVTKYDVAMHVLALGAVGEFVADESREFARIGSVIVVFGGLLNTLPCILSRRDAVRKGASEGVGLFIFFLAGKP